VVFLQFQLYELAGSRQNAGKLMSNPPKRRHPGPRKATHQMSLRMNPATHNTINEMCIVHDVSQRDFIEVALDFVRHDIRFKELLRKRRQSKIAWRYLK
jgi:hypothetical protein